MDVTLLASYLKPLRLYAKGKHSANDADAIVTSMNGDRKIMQPIKITSWSAMRKRQWDQFSQIIWTSTKVISIEDLQWIHFDDNQIVQGK